MVTSKRADAFAIYYMPETTYGVDPGIVTAVNNGTIVNGTDETYLYVPTTSRPAYARITGKVDGLPRRAMVDAEQVFPVTDSAPFSAKGTRGATAPFSFEMLMHGGLLDTVGTDTDRPIPPPWLQLAGSASGRIIGHRAGDSGGGNGSNHYSVIAGSAPTPAAHQFTISAGAGTVGAFAPGHVFGVDHGTGTSTPDIELVRPVRCEAATTFGDTSDGADAAGTSGARYNGTTLGLKQAPTAADRVYFTAQANFDRRYEDSGTLADADAQLSFTILILRPEAEACQLITGARCCEFEITDNVNEIPKIKLSFLFKSFKTMGEDGTAGMGATTAITDEPAYYSNWPCPKVTSGANVSYIKYLDAAEDGALDSPTVVRDTPLVNFSVRWSAGHTVRHSNMAGEGVEDVRQTQRQELEVKFTTLYIDDWRDMLGLCSAVDTNGYNSTPFLYWSGEKRSQLWYVAFPTLQLKDDPGPGDGDYEGNMAQDLMFNWRPYRGDLNAAGTAEIAFSTTATYHNKFALGTM